MAITDLPSSAIRSDPFYYSYFLPSIPVPYKTVTFANGRAVVPMLVDHR
jgi:hypothetical protein